MWDFLRIAWRPAGIDPAEFDDNWHIGAICEHLEAVVFGQIKRLIFQMPFRHGKTIGLTCVVPWTWLQRRKRGLWCGPQTKFTFASYGQSISDSDSRHARRIIASDWYQESFGDRFKIDEDQVRKFTNDKGGQRLATSVGGVSQGTGFGIGCIDDPLKAIDAFSIVKRQRAAEWYDGSFYTRRNDPQNSAIIVNAQRIATDDLTGHILKREGPEWTVVCLPARYEHSHPYVYAKDPRKTEGEPLWKNRFGDKELAEMERNLGAHTAAAQLQQRPTPRQGGIVQSNWFNLWPHAREFPKFEFVVQCYDTAFEEDDKNELTGDPDFTVCHTWGVFKVDDLPRSAVLLNRWAARLAYPDLRTKAVEWARMGWPPSEDPKAIKQRAAKIIVEKKASGISLIQDLARLRLPVEPYDPRGDKLLRLHLGSPMVKKGRIWLPESKQRPDNPVRWCDPMIEQVCTFRGEGTIPHDDEVDAFSMFLRYMIDLEVLTANSDRLMSESEEMYGEDEAALIRRQSQKKRRNPYG